MIALPRAGRWVEKYGPQGLKVLSIHCSFHKADDQPAEKVREYHATRKLPFPVGLDARKDGDDATSTLLRYKCEKLPLLVVVDKKGIVRFTGDETADEAEVTSLIERLMKEE